MRTWILLAASLSGCGRAAGPEAPDDTEEPRDTGEIEDTGDPDDTGGPDPIPLDEAAALDAIAGRRDVGEVLVEVAWRGGWPVRTQRGTFLVVLATDTPDAWSVAGDHAAWVASPMIAGPGLAWAELEVPDVAGSRYKVVREGAWRADPTARSFTYDAFGEISYVAPPSDGWRLDRWPGLRGEGLPPRPVHALVPPGAGPWPTLYVADGQNLFDPGAPWGGWRLAEAAAAAPAPALIVGVFAGPDRLAEYAHVDDRVLGRDVRADGAAYGRLVRDHLRPRIEAAYGAPSKVGLLGSSMGGLASLAIAHGQPGAWDFAGSMSGTLGWGRFSAAGPTVEELYVADPRPDLVVYVDSGGAPGGGRCDDVNGDGSYADDPDHTDNYCTNRAFADALAAAGWRWGDTLTHWHEPGAPHNEAAWADRVHRPLAAFLGEGR